MGKLKQLIAEGTKCTSAVSQNYSEGFPPSIADKCGSDEVGDIIRTLDELSIARDKHNASEESWDGDASDDLWRAQKRLASLLILLVPRFPNEIAAGLRSQHSHTRFWVAYAFENKPNQKAISMLKEALLMESEELNKSMMQKALSRCKRKVWLPFV